MSQDVPKELIMQTLVQISSPKTNLPPSTPGPSHGQSHNIATPPPQRTCLIKDLNYSKRNWVIKARITKRSPIIPFKNRRGKFFIMNLCDDSGEIKATAFNNECDKFFNNVQMDKVFYISNCKVKGANKQCKYTDLNNDYEMEFTPNTMVTECLEDNSAIPAIKYDFVPINEIANKHPSTSLDVIGICISVGEVQKRKSYKLREIILADSSGGPITLTLWNTVAENFEGDAKSVVLVKGAKVKEYMGKKQLFGSVIRIDPELPQTRDLKTWYDANDILAKTNEWITFEESDARQLVNTNEVYRLHGVITSIVGDNAVYKACPQNSCYKKLEVQESGLFHCKKCNKECSGYKHVLRIEAVVSDTSGARTIIAFHKTAEAILGRDATEIQQMLDSNENAYARLFEGALFKIFLFKFRNKTNTFMGNTYLYADCVGVEPFDNKEAITRLTKSIKLFAGVEI